MGRQALPGTFPGIKSDVGSDWSSRLWWLSSRRGEPPLKSIRSTPCQAEKKAPHDAWTSSMFGWSLAGQFSHSQHPIIAIICLIKCEIRSHFASLTAVHSISDVSFCHIESSNLGTSIIQAHVYGALEGFMCLTLFCIYASVKWVH